MHISFNNKDIVLQHLKAQGTITAAEALMTYGIHRLAPRIYELRQEGFEIEKFSSMDRRGRVTATYKLTKE